MEKKIILNESDFTRKMLNRIRTIEENRFTNTNKKRMLNEETEKADTSDAIAITDDPQFGQNTLTNQIEQFRSSVESGAQFSKPDNSKLAECPLIYIPSTGNLVFSGIIPCLNNLKWQFVLKTKTGKGCFIFVDGLVLDRDNMQILSKLFGFYENWREQWNTEASDLEKMANNIKNK